MQQLIANLRFLFTLSGLVIIAAALVVGHLIDKRMLHRIRDQRGRRDTERTETDGVR